MMDLTNGTTSITPEARALAVIVLKHHEYLIEEDTQALLHAVEALDTPEIRAAMVPEVYFELVKIMYDLAAQTDTTWEVEIGWEDHRENSSGVGHITVRALNQAQAEVAALGRFADDVPADEMWINSVEMTSPDTAPEDFPETDYSHVPHAGWRNEDRQTTE